MTERIRAVILDLALARGRDRSLCPSEVARALAVDWRPLMPEVRAVAATMPEIMAIQGGAEVDPVAAKGPIRLRLR
ncbi:MULTISPECIES: DUF3253 domain-containing protein [Tabrizicola]|uniref:DUF3253 domain-containing protein n=1 Tax=Tabrizicola TaxID=1443919 RepID=UPI001F0D44BA|nr:MULTISPECIES: DUF3253 domain-containing protein [Paracoccaceae]